MNKRIKQHDRTDCAAACIASIARHYGRDIPLTIIREASGTSAAGTSIKGIIDAAAELGFIAKGYKSEEKDISPLAKISEPAILHIINEYDDLHFVVLYNIRKGKAIVMDPATGTFEKIPLGKLTEEWSGFIVTMIPNQDGSMAGSSFASRFKLLKYMSCVSIKDYLLMMAGSAVYIVAGICTALFLQCIIDEVIPSGEKTRLIQFGTMMALLMGLTLAVGYGRIIFTLRAGIKLDGSLTLTYIRHLFSLPAGFFSKRGAGELNSRIGDISRIRSFITTGIADILASVMILIVSFTLMFICHSKLAFLMLSFIPLYMAIYIVAEKINKRVNRDVIENSAAFEEKTIESINAVKVIKYFGAESIWYKDIEKKYVRLAERLFNAGKFNGLFGTGSDAISKLLTVTLLTVGSLFIFSEELTVGELVSFYSLSAYFSAPLSQLVGMSSLYSEAKISAERLGEIIDLEPEGIGHINYPLKKGQDITIEDIHFAYPGCPTLIDKFSLTLKSGQITAIQGESGCGKSSLASLLMRDYRTRKGKIAIGGIDINLIDLEEWRQYVSIVPQDPVLINCTLLENITCGQPNPDLERAISILNDLGMKTFVNDLPMGILTKVGERGCSLSGGQRQRIALARALYRDPQVIILDEATSSLDEASERFILGKLKKLRNAGKTIVMITHKNDNIRIADKVVNMSARSERSIPQA